MGLKSDGALYGIDVMTIDGRSESMDVYRGRVLLVVNVASRCGFTPQYAGLEALHRRYVDRGFAVLGFPCNQFGRQEPGTEADISRFCDDAYGVSFPLFAKVDVNGPGTHPLFRMLKSQRRGVLGSAAVKWNFTKFLIDRAGEVVARFGSAVPPEKIDPEIARLLMGRP
jgi:glutathione peroxidase